MNTTYHMSQIANLRVERLSETNSRIRIFLEKDAVQVQDFKLMSGAGFNFSVIKGEGDKLYAIAWWYNGSYSSAPTLFEDDDIEEYEGELQETVDFAMSTKEECYENYRIMGTDIVLVDPRCGVRMINYVEGSCNHGHIAFEPTDIRLGVVRLYQGKAYGVEQEQAHRVCSGLKAMLKEQRQAETFGELSFAGVKFNGNWNML